MLIERNNVFILDGAYASHNSYFWVDIRITIRNKKISTHINTPTHKNIRKIDYDKENVMEGFRKIMLCKIISQFFKIID